MTTSEFGSINPELASGLPDIAQLTRLANELFTQLPCDGSRLSAVSSFLPRNASAPSSGFDKTALTEHVSSHIELPGEAELRSLFAPRQPSLTNVPDYLNTDPVLAKQSPSSPSHLSSPLNGLDKAVLDGILALDTGLPVAVDLDKLLVTLIPTGSHGVALPEAQVTSESVTQAAEFAADALAQVQQAAAIPASPPVSEEELQRLVLSASSNNPGIPSSSKGSPVPGFPVPSPPAGLTRSLEGFDVSLIVGLSPEIYGLPGEAELQQLFTVFSRPADTTTDSSLGSGGSYYFLDELKTSGFNVSAADFKAVHPPFDVHLLRRDFPILKETVNGYPLAWFDNAATTQKPQVVIDRLSYFYEHENSNIHRAAHELAARATDAYEDARGTVAKFLNAPTADTIIFVRGTTEAINLIAKSWGVQNLVSGDEIVITWLEHHANIVPWQQLCEVTGAVLRVAPVDESGQVLLGDYQKLLSSRTKIVSFTHVSNALGTVTPAQEIIAMAHRVGAKVLLDAAQSVSHLSVDVQGLDCDWCVFSGHKIFGPTGIGVVYGKPELLEATAPWQGGGNMIEDVTFEKTIYQHLPARFEAGTGNIADAVGLGAALSYLSKIGLPNVARYEHELLEYAMEALKSIPGLRLIGTAKEKTSVLSFVLAGHSNQDIGVALNKVGIAVRTGHHCAQPILRRFGLESTVRPSLAFYNTYEEVNRLVTTVRRIQSGKSIYQ
jgi:cysteine desulfurase / selenocysteine lyase